MFLIILKDALAATLGVICVCSLGVYLTKRQFITKTINKQLSKIIEQLLTPCLILTSFIESLDLNNPQTWLPAVTISIAMLFIGHFLAKIMNVLILKDKKYNTIISLAVTLSMTTNIQLNVSHNLRDYLEQISVDYQKSTTNSASGETRAITYIMIYTFVNTIARWSYAKTQVQNFHHQIVKEEQGGVSPQEEEDKQNIFVKIFNYFNPPLAASVISVVLLLIMPNEFRNNLLSQGTYLNRAIFYPINTIGRTQPPIVLTTLGSNLYFLYTERKTAPTKMPQKSVIGIIITKLLICPILGGIILYNLYSMQFITDPVLLFVSILTFSTPTAINLMIVSQLYGPEATKEVSKLLLIGYSLYTISLPTIMLMFFSWIL